MLGPAMKPTALSLALLFVGFGAVAGCNRSDPYSDCNRDLPCGGDAPLCLSSTTVTRRTVQFCSKRCSTPAANSAECPGNGACARLNGGDPVCVARCSSTADCAFTGAACLPLAEAGGATVCSAAP